MSSSCESREAVVEGGDQRPASAQNTYVYLGGQMAGLLRPSLRFPSYSRTSPRPELHTHMHTLIHMRAPLYLAEHPVPPAAPRNRPPQPRCSVRPVPVEALPAWVPRETLNCWLEAVTVPFAPWMGSLGSTLEARRSVGPRGIWSV